MRGTLALDEEDCAHLDALQQQRYQRDQAIQQQTQNELAAFRAAQAVNRIDQTEQQQQQQQEEEEENDDDDDKKMTATATTTSLSQPTKTKPFVPKIAVIKKKKRRLPDKQYWM